MAARFDRESIAAAVARASTTLREDWDGFRDRLRGQLIPPAELVDLLERAGCPTRPGQIGLTSDQVRESVIAARLIRRRYTVLDLVLELGIRDEVLAEG